MRIKILSFSFVTLLFMFLLGNTSLKAQVMLRESFEGSFPPTDWKITTVGTGRSWEQVTAAGFPYNGRSCMIFEQLFNQLANTWAFSKPVALTAGINYRLSYWYGQTFNSTGYERLKVTIGSGATIAAQTTTLHDYQTITNNEYVEGVDNFTVPTSGNYNIGFNCYSNENSKRLVLDSIVLMANFECNGLLSVGLATGPATICPAVPFRLNLNWTNATDGLSLQWQSSPEGANNFTNIIGANDTVLNSNQTTARDYRCVVTCINGGATYLTNTVSVKMNVCYCTPVTTCSNSYQLTNVKFGSINNSTTCVNSGYGNYTATIAPATINTGSTVPISLGVQSNGLNYAGVWIDYNQDSVFESNEFTNLGFTDNGATINTLTLSSAVLIPNQALPGKTRMRVRLSPIGPLTATDACSDFSAGEIEDYQVNIVFVPVCSGIPTGIITAALSNIVCPTSFFTLTFDSSYVNIDLAKNFSFQWQSSPAGTNSFTNIIGANDTVFKTNQTTAIDFRCLITCKNIGPSYITNTVSVKMNVCYCTSITICGSSYQLTNVKFGSINNSTTCVNSGYGNYTTNIEPATIYSGSTVPIILGVQSSGLNYAAVWIDYNQDSVFESNEFTNLGYTDNGEAINTLTLSGTVLIPNQVLPGKTRMRVRLRPFGPLTASDACTGFSAGETEDYLVNVVFVPVCAGIPIGGITASVVNSVCPSTTFILRVDSSYVNNDLAKDFLYQWQSSLDENNWTNIAGADSLSLNIAQTEPTFYRRRVTCSSGEVDYSKKLFIKMAPIVQCYCRPSPSNCSAPLNIGIDSVSVNNMQNPSTCGLNGYTDYTGTVAPVAIQAGTFAKIFVKFNSKNTTMQKYAAVAIDFNHNGLYDLNEYTNIGKATTTIGTNLRIPFNALKGITGMRIRVSWVELTTMCWNNYESETEDYLVDISAATNAGPNFSFYVNPLATGNGDGLSWANAFKRLDTAISVALSADTIRVSKGTYSPPAIAPFYFNIKDSMVLLGGYPNIGNPSDALRNWGENQTILNGNGFNTIAAGANGFTLDGFILEALNSNASEGNALLLSNGVQPKIKNCVFRNNQNISSGSGSAIRIKNSSPIISDCFFINNYDSTGSTVLSELNSNAVFYNSIFYKNASQTSTAQSIQSKSTFINCDFVSNKTRVNKTVSAGDNSILTIRNSIFFNNYKQVAPSQNGEYSLDSSEISVSNSTVTISNSITQAYGISGVNGNMVSVDPKFFDIANASGTDNFFYTIDDGLNLAGYSPALNTGSNNPIAGINKDILNNPRVFNNVVDIGPYEAQFLPTLVLNTWVGSINSSWENPLNWSLGIIPNAYTAVIINSGTVIVNADTVIHSLSIKPGANVTVGAGYHLIILH